MISRLGLLPEQASTFSGEVDHLLYFLVAVSVFFTVLIFFAIFYFAIRYRRRSETEVPEIVHGGMTLEILWTVIPFGLTMVMFAWGASIFFSMNRPPDDAIELYAVGKQWMWKIQHMEGRREINELHIPVGRAAKVTMTSEDVIHSFFVPAFRTKADVLPGRYTVTWFKPTKVGKYHLYCAEYCGTRHSGMIGWVHVMEPQDYQAWLNGDTEGSLSAKGEKLFQELACGNCHKPDNSGRGPNLTGLLGRTVELAGGGTIKADEAYFRESIVNPTAKVAAGYQPLMPTFQGLVSEEGVLQLVEYIKSLTPAQRPGPGAGTSPAGSKQVPAHPAVQPAAGAKSQNR